MGSQLETTNLVSVIDSNQDKTKGLLYAIKQRTVNLKIRI